MTNDEGGRRLGLDNEQGKQIYTFYVNIGAGLTCAPRLLIHPGYLIPHTSTLISNIYHFLAFAITLLIATTHKRSPLIGWVNRKFLLMSSSRYSQDCFGWHLLPFVKTANRTEQPLWRQCPVKILLTNKWHNNRMTIQLQRNQYNLHFLWRLDNWIIISENRFSPFTVLLLRMQCNTGICAVYKVEIM